MYYQFEYYQYKSVESEFDMFLKCMFIVIKEICTC